MESATVYSRCVYLRNQSCSCLPKVVLLVLSTQPYEYGKLLDFEIVYAPERVEYNKNQLSEDIIHLGHEVIEDGTELDDPTIINGFINDCDSEEEIIVGDVSHAEK